MSLPITILIAAFTFGAACTIFFLAACVASARVSRLEEAKSRISYE